MGPWIQKVPVLGVYNNCVPMFSLATINSGSCVQIVLGNFVQTALGSFVQTALQRY